jgi:hypothetical protein
VSAQPAFPVSCHVAAEKKFFLAIFKFFIYHYTVLSPLSVTKRVDFVENVKENQFLTLLILISCNSYCKDVSFFLMVL